MLRSKCNQTEFVGFFLSRSLSCFHVRLKQKGWRSDIPPHLKHHRWVSVWVSRHSFFVNLERQVWLSAKWVIESGGQDQALFCSRITCAFSTVYNTQKRDVKVAVERILCFQRERLLIPAPGNVHTQAALGKLLWKCNRLQIAGFPHSKCNFHTLS